MKGSEKLKELLSNYWMVIDSTQSDNILIIGPGAKLRPTEDLRTTIVDRVKHGKMLFANKDNDVKIQNLRDIKKSNKELAKELLGSIKEDYTEDTAEFMEQFVKIYENE